MSWERSFCNCTGSSNDVRRRVLKNSYLRGMTSISRGSQFVDIASDDVAFTNRAVDRVDYGLGSDTVTLSEFVCVWLVGLKRGVFFFSSVFKFCFADVLLVIRSTRQCATKSLLTVLCCRRADVISIDTLCHTAAGIALTQQDIQSIDSLLITGSLVSFLQMLVCSVRPVNDARAHDDRHSDQLRRPNTPTRQRTSRREVVACQVLCVCARAKRCVCICVFVLARCSALLALSLPLPLLHHQQPPTAANTAAARGVQPGAPRPSCTTSLTSQRVSVLTRSLPRRTTQSADPINAG